MCVCVVLRQTTIHYFVSLRNVGRFNVTCVIPRSQPGSRRMSKANLPMTVRFGTPGRQELAKGGVGVARRVGDIFQLPRFRA